MGDFAMMKYTEKEVKKYLKNTNNYINKKAYDGAKHGLEQSIRDKSKR